MLASSTLFLPIATAMKRLDVDNIIVLKMAIKDIIPPRTEYNPKSLLPKALSANRVISNEHIVVIAIFEYSTIEFITIALLVFSCIANYELYFRKKNCLMYVIRQFGKQLFVHLRCIIDPANF